MGITYESSATADYHNIELQYNGSVQTMTLYDLPGIEFQLQKGDLWEFSLPSCITLHGISRVSVVANGDDGWSIGSIITLVQDVDDSIQLLTRDFGVSVWISNSQNTNFKLTLSDSESSGILQHNYDKPKENVCSLYSFNFMSLQHMKHILNIVSLNFVG